MPGFVVAADKYHSRTNLAHWCESCLAQLLPDSFGISSLPITHDAPRMDAQEEMAIARSCELRKLEFAWGRAAARNALEQVGFQRTMVPRGLAREPVWPTGAIGSIAHAAGIATAIVGRSCQFSSVGVDIESPGAVSTDIWRIIFTESEIARLTTMSFEKQAVVATTMFCAKEAFYKLQYPITRQWLNFTDVEIVIDESLSKWKVHICNRSLEIERLRGVLGFTAACTDLIVAVAYSE